MIALVLDGEGVADGDPGEDEVLVETVRLLEELASSLVATREEVVDADDVVRDGVVGVVLGEEVAEIVECGEVLGLEETGGVYGEILELERVFGEDSGMRGESTLC